ncbi:MAG: hypothetical protein QF879_11610 [Candidatus Latescibacteria bacterium]|nr:hypothetical protein [Candidatus Latescibacterota bacterium]MDP7235107.1 hypothetical protein [Candidatus Latescibacterota bacterium]
MRSIALSFRPTTGNKPAGSVVDKMDGIGGIYNQVGGEGKGNGD